jgi:hypothetical protein
MGEDLSDPFVCVNCGGAIGMYEPCLFAMSGKPVEVSWLSVAKDEREATRVKGTYHRACYSQGTAHAGDA